MAKKIVHYYSNKAYSIFLKEMIDRENPERIAFDYKSLSDFHDALSSSNEEIRQEARVMLDVLNYCRDRGAEIIFYGFDTYKREKLYEKISKKRKIHSTLKKTINKTFSFSKALEQPYWAQNSRKHSANLKFSRLNDKFFLGNPYHLHEAVLKEKINKLPDNTLVLAPFTFAKNIK